MSSDNQGQCPGTLFKTVQIIWRTGTSRCPILKWAALTWLKIRHLDSSTTLSCVLYSTPCCTLLHISHLSPFIAIRMTRRQVWLARRHDMTTNTDQISKTREICRKINTSRMFWVLILIDTSKPRQNSRRFPDDNFKCIFLNENTWIAIKISLKFVHKGPIGNIPALI